jgi:hypothetical protein
MKNIFKLNPDKAGFFASMLCAIHCAGVPVLISVGALSTSTWLHNHAIDWLVIGFGVVVASYSIVGDYIKKHKNIRPILLASLGFIFLFVGMIDHHGWMLLFSVAGGLMVATSHYINHTLTRSCPLF